MASSKRARDSTDEHDGRTKKPRTSGSGFSVGPKNLPPGTHRNKVSQIKQALIHQAKAKKELAKAKAQLAKQQQPNPPRPSADESGEKTAEKDGSDEPASLQPHPDRLALLEAPPQPSPSNAPPQHQHPKPARQRRPKTNPFTPARRAAQRRQDDAAQAARERATKLEQRERHRDIMAKARRGGQRSLATESVALLEKVRRLVGRDRSEGVVSMRRG